MYPFTAWGEGSTRDNPRPATLREYQALSEADVPDGAHGRIVGNMITGYRFELDDGAGG
jgi:hypothetical protein